ncbi:unnamed protein product [Rhizophagus irregularis]|nr:unnamed protein product [Rhizophagus irregularis]
MITLEKKNVLATEAVIDFRWQQARNFFFSLFFDFLFLPFVSYLLVGNILIMKTVLCLRLISLGYKNIRQLNVVIH